MAATSATQAYDDAKAAGFDQTDASIYHMAVFAGMFGLINNTEIGHWALKGLGTEDVSRGLNGIMKTEGGIMLDKLKVIKGCIFWSIDWSKNKNIFIIEFVKLWKRNS